MTHLEPEDILRRALHQAADSVEPATDGLSQIRARLATPRPLLIAWLVAAWETASEFVVLRLEPALAALADWLGTGLRTAERHLQPVAQRLEPVTDRLRPAFGWLAAMVAWLRRVIKPQTSPGGRPSRYAWVRPVIAMAAVVLVAVAGGFALSGLPHQISQAAQSVFSSTQPHGSGGTHGPGTSGGGQHLRSSPGSSSRNETSPSPSPSCSSKPKPKPTTSPTPTPTTQPTTTPTPTQTSPTSPPPTTTPPPTPTPSPSGSDTPSTNEGTQGTQGTQSAPASQSAQVSEAVFLVGVGSGSSPSPSPSSC
jgi:hypothetical protein